MLFRAQVRATAKALLTAALEAQGATTSSSKDTPIASGTTPTVIVYTDDMKTGTGGSPPQFRTDVLTTVELAAEGDTKDAAEALGDALCELAENCLLGDPQFVKLFELIDSVETRTEYRASQSRKHAFTAVMEIKAHTTEIFEPVISTQLAGINVYVDSVNVFDPDGTYDPPFDYPVSDAPRPAGPDGRAEIAASLNIPTE